MPELPEVETTLRGIHPHIQYQQVTHVLIRQHQLRWPIHTSLPTILAHQRLLDISRRSKYLLFAFEQGHLLVHLGMSGSLRLCNPTLKQRKHDHVNIFFGNNIALRYHDPRRFGCMLWHTGNINEHHLLKKLGPEPLTDAFHAEHLFNLSRKRKVAVKNFIMNAAIVVGVGNIYANESLFMSGIRPHRPAGKVTRKEYALLTCAIKDVLTSSIQQGGTTLRDFVDSNGQPGYFKQSLWVYGRDGQTCQKCNDIIKTTVIGQRSSYYCTHCQK